MAEPSVRAAFYCHLANATDLLTPVLRTIASGWAKLRSYFSPFVDQSSPPDYVSRRGRDVVCNAVFRLSISCSVPEIVAIEVRSCLKSRQKACFRPPIFSGEDPQILDLVFKIAPISDHAANFAAIGRETAEISRWIKKRNKQQQNIA